MVGEVGEHPLNPHTVVLFFRSEILKALCIEMAGWLPPQNLLGFFDIFFALIDEIDLRWTVEYLGESGAEQFFGDSTYACATVENSTGVEPGVVSDIVGDEFG